MYDLYSFSFILPIVIINLQETQYISGAGSLGILNNISSAETVK
jgi:hypothetical protein